MIGRRVLTTTSALTLSSTPQHRSPPNTNPLFTPRPIKRSPRELRDFSADSGGRFRLSRHDSILILPLDFLQVRPKRIEIFAEVLNELFAGGSCFLYDRVFPHAINLP